MTPFLVIAVILTAFNAGIAAGHWIAHHHTHESEREREAR